MLKEDRAPWYVIVCRIIMFLAVWLLESVFTFCVPFLADWFVMGIFDSPDPFYFNFFMDHQWLFYVWGLFSAGLSFCIFFRSLVRAFR